MKNFYEELVEYLTTTPHDVIVEEWEKSAECDAVGPTVEEYLKTTQQYFQTKEPSNICSENIKTPVNPKFSSGFLLYLKNYRELGSYIQY